MPGELTRDELIDLVERLQSGVDDEAVASALLEKVARNVPHPSISDLIYWPDEERTAEEIVDVALAYKPIET